MDSEPMVVDTANSSVPQHPSGSDVGLGSGTKEGVAEELRTGDVVVSKRDSCLSVTTNSVGVTSGGLVEGSSSGAIPVCTAKKTTMPLPKKMSKAEKEAEKLRRMNERLEAKARKEAEQQQKGAERQKKREEIKLKKEQAARETKERKEKRDHERKKKLEEQQLKLEARQKKKDEKRRKEQEEELLREEKLKKKKMEKDKFLEFFSRPAHKKNLVDAGPKDGLVQDMAHIDCALAQQQACPDDYLAECKKKSLVAARLKWRVSVVTEDTIDLTSRAGPDPRNVCCKLLQFHTNHRPAYFGSWRKKSSTISPRDPFRKEVGLVDYDVDSDEEWEEEEPGESLSHSEEDDVSCDEEDEDDGFFVPHGYLSEGEGEGNEEELENKEMRMEKQRAEAKAWELEFSRKHQILKPVKIGISWACNLSNEQSALLGQFAARAFQSLPIPVCLASPIGKLSCANLSCSYQPVPEEAMPDLIRLVHNSNMGLKKLVRTFRMHWGAKQPCSPAAPSSLEQPLSIQSPQESLGPTSNNYQTPNSSREEHLASQCNISKRQLENRILAIAAKEVKSPRANWQVRQEILQQYGFSETIAPLEVLGVLNKSTCRVSGGGKGAKTNSAQPPVKTLQHFFQNSSLSQNQKKIGSSSSGRRIKPAVNSHTPVKTLKHFLSPPLSLSQPGEAAATLPPTNHQVARKLELASEAHVPKRARLDNASSPIVIDSEESADLDVAKSATSTADEPMEVDPPNGTSAILEECTNRPCKPHPTDAPELTKIDWQNQWAQNNRLEVAVDVHL